MGWWPSTTTGAATGAGTVTRELSVAGPDQVANCSLGLAFRFSRRRGSKGRLGRSVTVLGPSAGAMLTRVSWGVTRSATGIPLVASGGFEVSTGMARVPAGGVELSAATVNGDGMGRLGTATRSGMGRLGTDALGGEGGRTAWTAAGAC